MPNVSWHNLVRCGHHGSSMLDGCDGERAVRRGTEVRNLKERSKKGEMSRISDTNHMVRIPRASRELIKYSPGRSAGEWCLHGIGGRWGLHAFGPLAWMRDATGAAVSARKLAQQASNYNRRDSN